VTTREDASSATRLLDADALLLARAIDSFPGAVIVVGNDWPLFYEIELIRQGCSSFGRRIVNTLRTSCDTKEEAVLEFMASRTEPYLVIASPDFEFTQLTASRRIDIDEAVGFENMACLTLVAHLKTLGAPAVRPVTSEEMLRATSSSRLLERAGRYVAELRAAHDQQFQRTLKPLLPA
jgi:hypothetical protein